MIPDFAVYGTQYLKSKPFAGQAEVRQSYIWAGGSLPTLDLVLPRFTMSSPGVLMAHSVTPAAAMPPAPTWVLPVAAIAAGAGLWWWMHG